MEPKKETEVVLTSAPVKTEQKTLVFDESSQINLMLGLIHDKFMNSVAVVETETENNEDPLLEGVKMPEFMEVVCVMIPFLTVLTGMAVGIYYAALDEEAKLEKRLQYNHKKVEDDGEDLEFDDY